jgi:iron complex outermembrane receptor protein
LTVKTSRASGTSNSSRSMVFADGIALSNLLGSGVGSLRKFVP